MLRSAVRAARVLSLLLVTMTTLACQSPTDADDVVDYDEVVDVTASPDPVSAGENTDGRTYRVARNDQPDDILAFDWHAVFSVNIVFNNDALDDDVDIDFPVRLTSTTLTVKQAVGGVITPPTGSDTEHWDFAPLSASSNMFSNTNSPVNMSFEVWYDLPSLRREAVITLTLSFLDDDGAVFQKVQEIRVAP